jgi:hypothetical protein
MCDTLQYEREDLIWLTFSGQLSVEFPRYKRLLISMIVSKNENGIDVLPVDVTHLVNIVKDALRIFRHKWKISLKPCRYYAENRCRATINDRSCRYHHIILPEIWWSV